MAAVELSRVEELFHRASDLPEETRSAAVRAWCEEDARLAEEILTLLDSDSLLASGQANAPMEVEGAVDDAAGSVVGSYRLLRPLGAGGMGVVYLAEGQSGAGARTRVAVKLLQEMLLSTPAQQQFLLERDALARLNHPGIARLLDGDFSDERAPFLVMEYVEGDRLDRVCDRAGMPIAEVIGLAEQLCEALAYAHSQLILHRDLKPANVMVTAEGRVKLLDFGTLKLLGSEEERSAMTQAGLRPMTLRYASPEQLQGQRLSTASDVYSLGLVLYRMFAGKLPPHLEGLAVAEHFDDLRRGDVPPPCGLQGRPIAARLAADLSAVVMKAMRYEPAERYASVGALLLDLQHAARGERVSARGDALRYRAEVFYARNRRSLLALASCVLALTAGLTLMLHEAHRATVEQQYAQAGVETERRLAHFLLFGFFDELRDIPGSVGAQETAVKRSLSYLDGLAVEHEGRVDQDRAVGYTQLGTMLGDPYEHDLGDTAGGLAAIRKAVALSDALRTRGADNAELQVIDADARTGLGQIYVGQGEARDGLPWLRSAAELARGLANAPAASTERLARAAYILNSYGDVYGQESDMALHDGARSSRIYAESRDYYARALQRDPSCYACRSGIALEEWKLGMMQRYEDAQQAAEDYRAGLQILADLPAAELARRDTARRRSFIAERLAEMESALGEHAAAVAHFEEARAECLELVRRSPRDLQPKRDLADIDSLASDAYIAAGRYTLAVARAHEYVLAQQEVLRADPNNQLWKFFRFDSEYSYSKALRKAGRVQEANEFQRRAVQDAIAFARLPHATNDVLRVAASILTDAHKAPELAASFAERNARTDTEPTAETWVVLAKAEAGVGHREAERKAAASAHAYLDRFPRCPRHDELLQALRRLRA